MTTEILERKKVESDFIEDMIARGYTDVMEFTQEKGAQKEGFTGVDPLGRPVFITKDKKPTSRAAEILNQKGLSSENEARVAKRIPLDQAITHGVNPIMDSINYNGSTVNVWPHFENSMSLKKWVNEKGALNKHEFRSAFTQYLESERFLYEDLNMLHRDPNPGNLLIRPKKRSQELEARLIDLGTTVENTADSISPITTGPARSIRDPTIDNIFGKGRKYDEKSEVYAVGMNAIYAITGDFPIYYDFIKGVAFSGSEDLLNEDGTLNQVKHQKALDKTFAKFPKWAKKHVSWIRQATTLEPEKRPTIQKLNETVREACQPSILEKMSAMKTRTKAIIAAGLVGVTALTGCGIYKVHKDHVAELHEASKYPVTSYWDGWNSELANNFAELKVNISAKGDTNIYPYDQKVRVQQGGELWVNADTTLLANDPFSKVKESFRLPGRMYLEGVSTNDVPIEEFSSWPTKLDSMPGEGYTSTDRNIKIPKDLKPGVYNLAVELMAPTEIKPSDQYEKARYDKHFDEVKYSSKIISRKRIPIVVGKPDQEICISSTYLEGMFNDRVGFRDIKESRRGDTSHTLPRGKDLTYEFHIPQENYSQIRSNDYGGVWLPDGTNTQSRVLNVLVKDKGEIINHTGIQVKREYDKDFKRFLWRLADTQLDLPINMYEFRKEYDSGKTNYSLPSEKTSK